MLCVQLLGGGPSNFGAYLRDVIKFAFSGDDSEGEVKNFVEADHVQLRSIANDRQAVPNMWDNQSVYNKWKKFTWYAVAHMRQTNQNALTLFY